MSSEPDRSLEAVSLFSTPLIRARHPELTRLIQPLKKSILQRKDAHPGMKRSNQGGWHSDNGMQDWGGEATTRLIMIAADTVERHLSVTDMPDHLRMGWNVDIWANVNTAGDVNAQHCHPGAFASAVFYVDMGNDGAPARDGHLVLEDPRYPMAHMQHPSVLWHGADGKGTASQVPVLPQTGELIVFPSWLRHSVRPHTGRGERISIAINLSLQWQMKEAMT